MNFIPWTEKHGKFFPTYLLVEQGHCIVCTSRDISALHQQKFTLQTSKVRYWKHSAYQPCGIDAKCPLDRKITVICTVEPLYNGHLGPAISESFLLLYRGFPLSEVKMY